MADNRNNQRRQRRRPARQPRKTQGFADALKRRKRASDSEFKPDAQTATWIKTFRMTQQQRLRLTKWVLYILTVILSLVVQDVIMSQVSIFGATTDLAVCAILLITVLEGTEVGSIFVLIFSVVYFFSGSAPHPYCIGILTVLGVGATMFRQMYWHRSSGSVVLCAALALTGYELGLFGYGVYSGLTHFGRIIPFLLTALYSCAAMIPMYSLIHKIGLIGGNTWKE